MLTGHGLVAREWTEADLPAMVAIFDDADVAYRTPMVAPFDLAAARAYLARTRHGMRLHLAITTDGLAPLGEVMFNSGNGCVSYVVGAAHRGRGLASRAVRLMTEHAHRAHGLRQVLLEIEPDNEPSAAVARATGFRPAGLPTETVVDKGRAYDLETWVHTVTEDG
jgi:RimJ/RimL family protein N-acetyltransferase